MKKRLDKETALKEQDRDYKRIQRLKKCPQCKGKGVVKINPLGRTKEEVKKELDKWDEIIN